MGRPEIVPPPKPGMRFTVEWQDAQIEGWNQRPMNVSDLLAAVRSGVESGEIEGEVTKVEHDYYDHHASDGNLVKAGTYLVIPVSDGGEDA